MRVKIVNGIEVRLTPEEEAARDAEETEWANRHVPTDDEIDQDELNRALAAKGSVLRAMAEVQFGIITGMIQTTPELTKAQYVALLKSQMRRS